jgi:hypothetical protein
MEQRLAAMEADNGRMRTLLTSLAAENTTLKEQLASLTRGAAAALNTHGSSPEPAVLECLVTMHLVCCFLMCVRASLGVVLPLLPALAQQVARAAGPSPVCSRRRCLTVDGCCSSSWSSSSSEQRCCGSLDADAAAAPVWWRTRLRPAVVCV